ncbi:MAG: energy-coupling factor transporter ATPase [Tissierellia bacterium]|nr:energy-coupling factor transporter ATPase [Tissierellia bacterium]
MPITSKNIIEMVNVSYRYPTDEEDEQVIALKDICLTIAPGEYVAVLGHNGSGKSTLAKLLNALILPSEGKVFVNGLDTSIEKNLWEIRKSCGMVFQNPDNQLVATIVEEDVAFGPENLGVPMPELRRRVDEALRIVEMEEYKRHSPHLLSGGQKQRVTIAGILAMQPSCIVLDEPTAMLDPKGREEILRTIKRLNTEDGITIINITHYMEEAVEADRVIVMDDGVIALDGSPRQVFSQVGAMKEFGLDVPQVTELAYLLHQSGFCVPKDVLRVEELVNSL